MLEINVYTKEGCELCGHTKRKLDVLLKRWGRDGDVKLTYWDLETADGLAEAAFNEVYLTPTTVVSRDGETLARWEAEVPDSRLLKECIEDNHEAAAD